MEDLKKRDINKGKLFTGDLAYKDNDDYFYIVGRKNRISKIFGLRIDLDDIEKKLKKSSFKIKCIPDNKYLRILIINDYNLNMIKKIIDIYIIRSYAFISKVYQLITTIYENQFLKMYLHILTQYFF